MARYKKIKIGFVFLFLIVFIRISFACYTPIGGDEDSFFNSNSGDNLTICSGSYIFNDSSGDGVFHLSGNNYTFDCNYTTFFGNQSGSRTGLLLDIQGDNISVKNCNIKSFELGIIINGSNNNIQNINLSLLSGNGILVYKLNNNISSINYWGDYNGDAIIKLNGANNSFIKNIYFEKPNYGFDLYLANNNTIKDVEIREDGSYGFMMDSSNENYIENITIEDSGSYAFRIAGSNNTFNKLSINNTNWMNGIDLGFGSSYNVINNSIISFTEAGIYVSSNNNIIDNLTAKNNSYSVTFAENDNTLINSNLSYNSNYGVSFESGASGNYIYNNYFSHNPQNVYFDTNVNNYFNITKRAGTSIVGGSYIGGNFYEDYNGSDSDSDDIVDTPYNLTEGVFDYLPLVRPSIISKAVTLTLLTSNLTEGDNMEYRVNWTNLVNPLDIFLTGSCEFTGSGSFANPFTIACTGIQSVENGIDTLNITDSEGYNQIIHKNITIKNIIPYNLTIDFVNNTRLNYTFRFTFDDFYWDPSNITINWGDNTSSKYYNSQDFNLLHHFTDEGNYTISFYVEDDMNISETKFVNFTILDTYFKTLTENTTIDINDTLNLTLVFNRLDSESDLNISWDDGNYTIDSSSLVNGSNYSHKYDDFGEYNISSEILACTEGSICSVKKKYTYRLSINVIGYGDGIINGNESCDTNNFGGKTCSDYGYNAGSLSCNNGVINSSNCYTSSSGGGSSSHSSDDESEEDDIEISSTNSSKTINNISSENKNLENSSTKPTQNNTKLLENQTFINNTKEFNNSFNITENNKINLTNEDLLEEFNFKEPTEEIFNYLISSMPSRTYDFKSKTYLIFKDLKNDLENSSNSKFNFQNYLQRIFENINNQESFNFISYLNEIFERLGVGIRE